MFEAQVAAEWARVFTLGKARPKIAALFEADPARAKGFSREACGLLYDFSKTALTEESLSALLDLAEAADVEAKRAAMFAGEKINASEGRAVLHTALRAGPEAVVKVDGHDVMPDVRATLARMQAFARKIRASDITDVVNIGIGGSDLGPAMATQALAPYGDGPRVHFVSNIDGAHIHDVLKELTPAKTLVVVASKTFTTIETMTNAKTARRWLAAHVAEPAAQFVAISSAEEKAAAFGIPAERVFGFEDWVGGRYSVWGPIGLSLMLAIGPEQFEAFLAGAREMDTHFTTAPLRENIPVLHALVGLWHHQVCGHATRAVLPYEQRLARLPAYLQQLEMESNGKRVRQTGQALAFGSGPVVWGEPGTNGQHAFYQLLHQGTEVVPAEFLVAMQGHEPDLADHHALLVANCLAQSQALMLGRSHEDPQRVFEGNRPSVTMAYERLTPKMLGRIIALYEHRVFVEGAILGINSFDQFGVELGKEMATALHPVLDGAAAEGLDSSTARLAAFYRSFQS